MIFTLATIIVNIFGLDFTKATRIARWVFIGLLLVVLIAAGLFLRSCFSRKPKLDEKAIQTAQKAIAEQDRKTMIEVLTNSDVAEKRIDANLANAKTETINAIQDARKNAEQMTNEELAAELNRRANK